MLKMFISLYFQISSQAKLWTHLHSLRSSSKMAFVYKVKAENIHRDYDAHASKADNNIIGGSELALLKQEA